MDWGPISDELVEALAKLRFGPPVTHVYNPLVYARAPYDAYLTRYGGPPKQVVFLGMNPGPWGMAQTGVPFGEVAIVRDWLGIDEPIGKPVPEHPRRPVLGLECHRSEVSGKRIWGWIEKHFQTPNSFFNRFFIGNYCPLAFLEESGRNRTPDRLPVAERRPLFEVCDRALQRAVEYLQPQWVIGIGRFAQQRAAEALEGMPVEIGMIAHPSPASPQANKGWEALVHDNLRQLGISLT